VEMLAREPAPASPLYGMAAAARNPFHGNGGDNRMKIRPYATGSSSLRQHGTFLLLPILFSPCGAKKG
jgi:hypothetical protein